MGIHILVTKNDVILYQSARFHDTLMKYCEFPFRHITNSSYRYHKEGGVGILAEIEKELHEAHPAPGTPNVVAPPIEVQKYYNRMTMPEADTSVLGHTQSTLDV